MNEKILKMGKDEKEGNDRKRMINTIMIQKYANCFLKQ
mgnify:CR=1 FL=1